jgi:transposase InsO family protein
MLAAGLATRHKRRRVPNDTGQRPVAVLAANIPAREFVALAPGRRWVADITYLRTDERWLYAAVVVDLASRLVIGWSITLKHGNAAGQRCGANDDLAARRPGAELVDRGGTAAMSSSNPAIASRTRRGLQHEPFWQSQGQRRPTR